VTVLVSWQDIWSADETKIVDMRQDSAKPSLSGKLLLRTIRMQNFKRRNSRGGLFGAV
jgi:hypothetical protein